MLSIALGLRDLVGAAQRLVDPPHDVRHGIDRIQRLVRIHLARGIGVGRDLPAGQVDRLQTRLDLLHRLVAGERAERRHKRLGLQQLPQPCRAHLRQRVADAEVAGQALDILVRVVAADAVEAFGIGDEMHLHAPGFGDRMRQELTLQLRSAPEICA